MSTGMSYPFAINKTVCNKGYGFVAANKVQVCSLFNLVHVCYSVQIATSNLDLWSMFSALLVGDNK